MALLLIGLVALATVAFIYVPDWQRHQRLSGFFNDTGETAKSRADIWSYAGTQFVRHPLLGLGFGGWANVFLFPSKALGLRQVLPPHNTFIELWADSGIAAPIIDMMFVGGIIAFVRRCVARRILPLRVEAVYFLAGFLWLFIHGMGENEGPVGDMHELPILAALLGGLYGGYTRLERNLP